MIFSDSEREYYRKELEAASNVGDKKRVRRLIDQIRLLGEIREDAPKIEINLCHKGIEEYIKQQKALDGKLGEHTAQPWGEMFEGEGSPLEYIIGKTDTPSEDKMWEDILSADFALTDRTELPFRAVLQQGFKDSGWVW